MADVKISGLPAATTPLAGTEVLPIVQSGSTVKVANNDLRPKQIQSNATSGVLQVAGPSAAATRVMTVPDANFTAARTDASQSFTGDQTINGVRAGKGNNSATNCTAFGASALNANTSSGTNNTAIGFDALFSNTSGVNNVGVGSYALLQNTTGSYNLSVGFQSLFSNLSGDKNIAFGTEAIWSNSTGYNNTGVGSQALYSNSTGAYNTAVGDQSGKLITTGNKNTILGSYNGNQGGLDIRTANNYVVLSDGDGNPLISTNSTRSLALNGAVPQTGTGITFPATQSASSDVNTLDDYEEGTWTPADASGAGLTFTSVTATYTKIGNTVYINATLTYPTTTDVSQAKISGLPFAPSNVGQLLIGGPSTNANNAGQGWIPASSTTATLVVQNNTAKTNALLSTLTIYITGNYPV